MGRVERDLLGEREVPADVYWGIHTLRALENFQVTGTPIGVHRELVVALARVKQAAAEANRALGLLDDRVAAAIVTACEEIQAGRLHDQFVVDVLQGGAGTSTNMNANEVIANRALEILGRPRGEYATVHPNEHVNLSQSTNDVYPTAIRLALIEAAGPLHAALERLGAAFADKAAEFADVVKIGRTQLQDAVPMTVGQELAGAAATLAADARAVVRAVEPLHEINLGGTAVGTGIGAPDGFAAEVRAHLERISGARLSTAADLVAATQDVGALVGLSGVLRQVAVRLSKICNDLRLLSSGPQAGLGELRLPPMQAGSSIMPGKVNPVIPELVNQIAFAVVGRDVTVTMAAEAGEMQLNAFEPVMLRSLLDSLAELRAGCDTLRERCVSGITVDAELLERRVSESLAMVTALIPHIGYDRATHLVEEARATGRPLADVIRDHGVLADAEIATVLHPAALAGQAPDDPRRRGADDAAVAVAAPSMTGGAAGR